jgi:hypothetical protein
MYYKLLNILMKYNKYGSLPKFKDEHKNVCQFKRKSTHKPVARILIIVALFLLAYLIYIGFISNRNYQNLANLN